MSYTNQSLPPLSPLDGRYKAKIAELAPIFSENGLIRYRTVVEVRWFLHLAAHGCFTLSPSAVEDLDRFLKALTQDAAMRDAHIRAVKNEERALNHDVKAVEHVLQREFQAHPEIGKYTAFWHFACTSEDINNLAYTLMLADGRKALLAALDAWRDTVCTLAEQYAEMAMLAHTHGQAASPTTLGKEFANSAYRVHRQMNKLRTVPILGKINGAVGNYNAHRVAFPDKDWRAISQAFVEGLGLSFNPYTIQIEPHDSMAEMLHTMVRINTVLMDFAQDVWLYIHKGYLRQRAVAGEVGSSVMPHKVNPIDFENAEGNLGLANALLEFFARKLPVSRMQRDLTDSTVLRNLGLAFGHSLLAVKNLSAGLGKVAANDARIAADLEASVEVLTEAVQTVMRRHGMANAYHQLKDISRGKPLDMQSLQGFIDSLAIPSADKARLAALTPQTYTGLATELARDIRRHCVP